MTNEEIRQQADELLAKTPDEIAYIAGGTEQFYYLHDCHRLIRELLKKVS